MNEAFERLCHAWLDGTLSREGLAELNSALEADPEARGEFAGLLDLDASLGAMAKGREREPGRIVRGDFRPAWKVRLALAASVVLAAGVLWIWQDRSRPHAVVEEVAGVAGLASRGALHGETHEIAEGTVKLRTRRGALLAIEAPAVFRFESPQRLHLAKGRLAADVPPPAKGFTVVTPDGDAVDLGTRFGVDVVQGGKSEIHVFEGEVVARSPELADPQNLRGGEALAMGGGGGDTRELRSAAFIQPDELPSLSAALAAGQEVRARAVTDALRGDPDLVSLIAFEEASRHPGVHRLVQGRWPGSRAAEFVEVGDHLRLALGEGRDFSRLTLAAWVRLDRLGAPYQSLLHTDGWSEENPGQVHWMINGNATMRLALRGNALASGADEHHGFPDSRTPVLPERGRWVHLAVVYDSLAKTVRFYLNGRFDKETRLAVAHPARLGPAQIGNWDQQDRKLSGRIDELVVLGRVLDDAEIQELHEAGTPYR